MKLAKALKRLALLLAVLVIPLTACDPADVPVGDGLTSTGAGASCWGIKQAFPTSPDGIYWLYLPTLDRPTQFYCDMTTNGGGWVLVARGRDSWNFRPSGQSTPGVLRNTVGGTGAFSAAALSTDTINDLLNNQPVSGLTDGIRLERSTNASGTTRQDMRLFPTYTGWSWAFPQGLKLASMRIGSTNYANGNTKDTYSTFYDYPTAGLKNYQGTSRLRTYASQGNGWKQGFGFGTGVSGSNSASTFLYRHTATGFVLPFTRVWLRPQIANGSVELPAIPSQGFGPEAVPATLQATPETAPWGVTGLDHTGEDDIDPWNTTVNALKVYGDRVFVGGRFTDVQQGPGGPTYPQASLAAFDLDGNWISSFNPVFAGRVWAMTMTDDGKLIVGGDFSSVDGLPDTSGLVALDPFTGEVIPTWRANITHTSETHLVRGLDQRNGWIYATGRFNRVKGGTWNEITVSRAISVSATDGSPGTWKPILTGTGVGVRAAAAGDRVYLSGFFDSVNGDTNHGYYAITDSATGSPVPGMGPFQPSVDGSDPDELKYQYAVEEYADQIMVGGSEHDTQWYDRNRTTLLDSHLTKAGGDTQAIEVLGDWVYVGCHCDDTLLLGTNNFRSPQGFRSVHPINTVARFNPVTHEVDMSWFPHGLKGAVGEGIWAIDQDNRGCVWVGGDLAQGSATGASADDWLGGFGRFCPIDSTPPSAPSSLVGAAGTSTVSLSWSGSSDSSGWVGYDVYRNNRVIASVTSTSFTDTVPISGSRYAVRAYDATGNRSASTTPIEVIGPTPVEDQLLTFGSEWRWSYSDTPPDGNWNTVGFDDSTWNLGPGEFGFGDTPKATIISSAPAPRPLTSYYRRTVQIVDPAAITGVDLKVIRNSGAVVYVNGVEVARTNMPAGPVTSETFAAGPVPVGERHLPFTFVVPASAFVAGTNTIAVEMHLNSRNQATAGFDLAIDARH